jgi:hypothetical protein
MQLAHGLLLEAVLDAGVDVHGCRDRSMPGQFLSDGGMNATEPSVRSPIWSLSTATTDDMCSKRNVLAWDLSGATSMPREMGLRLTC